MIKFPVDVLFAGITDQGLYRVVGVGSKVQNLILQCIDKKKASTVDLADQECEWEVKTITSALKQYLRYVYNRIIKVLNRVAITVRSTRRSVFNSAGLGSKDD